MTILHWLCNGLILHKIRLFQINFQFFFFFGIATSGKSGGKMMKFACFFFSNFITFLPLFPHFANLCVILLKRHFNRKYPISSLMRGSRKDHFCDRTRFFRGKCCSLLACYMIWGVDSVKNKFHHTLIHMYKYYIYIVCHSRVNL